MKPKPKTKSTTTSQTPPNSENRQGTQPLMLRAAVQPKTVNAEERTVEVCFTSGADVLRYDWSRDQWYIQRLRVDSKSVDLTRLKSGAPLLNSHSQWSLESVLGVVEDAWIAEAHGYARLKFNARTEFWQDVADGILRNISVGFHIERNQELDERVDGYPVREATRWNPVELSLVPIPADPAAQVRSDGPIPPEEELMATPKKKNTEADSEETRSTPSNPSADAPVVDIEAVRAKAAAEARAEGAAAERQRASDIHTAVRKAGLPASFGAELVDEGVSADDARVRVLDRLADDDDAAPTRQVGVGNESRTGDFQRSAVEGLIYRGGGARPESAESRAFGAQSLVSMARTLLAMGGIDTRMMGDIDIAKRAMLTADFSAIIATVAARSLRAGYEREEMTFEPFMRRVTVANFRSIERAKLSDAPALAKVAEGDDYTTGTLSDDKETYVVEKYGKLLPFTMEALVNDDLDALTRVPSMMGNQAASTVLDVAWNTLLTNPNLADGNALFHASRNNTVTTVLDAAGLQAGRKYFRTRQTEKGRAMNLPARFLIVGPEQESNAEKLITDQRGLILADRDDMVAQRFRDSLTLIVESRITDLRWFLSTTPDKIDTCEVAFIAGREGPELEQDETFVNDDLTYKVRQIVGAAPIDGRGLYHSTGVAS
jgi:hypothetical protein